MLASQSRAGVLVRLFISILHQCRKHLREDSWLKQVFSKRDNFKRECDTDLSPAAVSADHVCVGHGGEQRVRLQVLRQAGQELSDVDEVHLEQDVLKQTQDAQPRPKQTLLPVPTEDVPHPTRHVQGERLAVQSEDPGQTKTYSVSSCCVSALRERRRRETGGRYTDSLSCNICSAHRVLSFLMLCHFKFPDPDVLLSYTPPILILLI